MNHSERDDISELSGDTGLEPEVLVAEVVPEPAMHALPVARIVRRRVWLPAGLFVATCLSTLLVGSVVHGISRGWMYALPVMAILICHEAGHFLQARRYGVYASFPYFIPMPLPPLGTFGAVIAMEARRGDRRALFDIGITGPLAGLVPTLVFTVVGLHWSEVIPQRGDLGDPILFSMLVDWIFGPLPAGHDVLLHPMAFAGWVGLLITSLNLLPIGQLDGGHILYGLLRTKAHVVATILLMAGAVAVLGFGYWTWTLMLVLLMLMGPVHPPTANDNVPLGVGRTILGWLTLAFIPIGFTPTPFIPGP